MKVEIEKCCECGKKEDGSWIDEVAKKLIEQQTCFKCNFWLDKVKIKDSEKTVRVNGKHFRIGAEDQSRGSFRGFGGSKFHIKFFDGREVKSSNLWHNGTIPEHFKDRLPNNAEFVYKEVK